jgi:hypothetical protein
LNINIEEKNFDKIAFRLLMIEKFENSQWIIILILAN